MNRNCPRRSALAALTGGALAAASRHSNAIERSATEETSDDRLPAFATLSELAAASPPSEVALVFVAGALRAGCGAALYRRVEREPFHAGKIRSIDGAWWEIVPGDAVNVLQFCARGDGKHDDGPAIQAALDYAIYVADAPKRVLLPPRRYRIDETLHVGYGDRYVTVELIGEPSASGSSEEPLGLYPTFNDRPCLNVQGGRRVRLRGLTLIGVNREYLRDRYDHLDNRGRRDDWLGPALGPASNNPHAPYAGITIDAYTGPPPPKPYPRVFYPAFLGGAAQYGRGASSDTILDNCRIEGFCVAVAVQPGIVPEASNADFMTYRDCGFNFNVVAIADSHSDSRCNNIENSRLHFNHTAIDTLTYGPGKGMFIARISGSSFDNNWRILNVDIGGSKGQGPFPMIFDGCYGEGVHHLGTVYASGAGAPGISFNGCKFEFSVKNDEFSPGTLLSCRAGAATFRNCVIQGSFGFACFDATVDLDGVAFSHLQCDIFDTKTLAGRISKSFTGGLWANAARAVRVMPSEFFDYSGRALDFPRFEGLDSRAFAISRETAADHRGRPVPWWVERLAYEGSIFPVGPPPTVTLDRTKGGIEVSGRDGAEYHIGLPSQWLTSLADSGLDQDYLFGPGDIVEDRDGGVLAYIVRVELSPKPSEIGLTLRVRQLTSVRTRDFGKSWEIERPIAEETCILVFHNARRYYPFCRRATMETQKGQAKVRLMPSETPGHENPATLFVAAGDYLLSNRFGSAPNERLFRRARVVDVDPGLGVVGLDSTAERDFWGESALFVKGAWL